MQSSTRLARLRRLILIGAVVAGIAVPAAVASYNGSPPDVRDAAAAAAAADSQIPDVLERYAAAHPYGAGQSTESTPVSRPPDVSDAAVTARNAVLSAQSSGFNWGDWAIGIGSGIGLALLIGAGVAMGLQRRHRPQTA